MIQQVALAPQRLPKLPMSSLRFTFFYCHHTVFVRDIAVAFIAKFDEFSRRKYALNIGTVQDVFQLIFFIIL